MLDLSVAIIVIMTGERLLAVSRPLQANIMFNKKKSSITVFVTLIFCAFVNSHFLLTHSIIDLNLETLKNSYKSNLNSVNASNNMTINKPPINEKLDSLPEITFAGHPYLCSHDRWALFYDRYWIFIDATIYSFLPFTLLTIFNISIVRFLVKAANESSKLKLYQKPLIGSYVQFNKKSSVNSNNSKTKSSYNAEYYEKQIAKHPVVTVKSSDIDKLNYMKKKYVVVDYNRFNTANTVRIYRPNRNLKQNYKGINKRLTIMLFLINVSFCVLSMPMVILQIIIYYNMSNTESSEISPNNTTSEIITTSGGFENVIEIKDGRSGCINLLVAIAEMLQYLNHSTNFFLYSFSGKTFRNEAKSCLFYYKNLLSAFRKRLIFKFKR
jgi:hypothetical protein